MKHHPPVSRTLALALLGCAFLLAPAAATHAGLFSPKGDSPEEKRKVILKQSTEMLDELYKSKPGIKDQVAKAAGYATFKMTDLNLFLLASGRGYGVVHDNKTGKDTYMCVAALGGGVGLGLRDLRVIFVFNDTNVLQQFVSSGWQFGGSTDAAAKYKDTGAAAGGQANANVDFKNGTVAGAANAGATAAGGDQNGGNTTATSTTSGMEIYQFTESGLSLQATVSGTKYWKDSQLNQ